MPTIGWGHSAYWQTQAPEPPITGGSGRGGYASWQTSVIIGSMLGGLQPVWQWAVSTIVKKDKDKP